MEEVREIWGVVTQSYLLGQAGLMGEGAYSRVL
jgi:hypothetical protein